MKNFKKLLALVVAGAMTVGSMSMMAFAEDSDLTVDEKVTVTGFEKGDTVTAYQFIKWVDGSGWAYVNQDLEAQIPIDNVIDGLDKDELATLAKHTDLMTAVTGTTTEAEWNFNCGTKETAGSYLILVAANDAEHVYNPAVVSADFDGTNDSAVDLSEDTANLKKQDVTLEKEIDNADDDYDVQVGDIVPFTVTVTVPQYNDNWTDLYFVVTDKLSTGLTIKTAPTIEGLTAGTDYDITAGGTEGDDGYTITFTETYLKKAHPEAIEIKYSALVGEEVMDTAQIHEETNTVTLEFSNNPENKDDHKKIEDETHHYTFAIDASRFGSGSESTGELIKVGVDSKGNTVTVYKEGETLPTGVQPLAGAEFTLEGTGPNNAGTYKQTQSSDSEGRIFFNNLEAGTYTLKETKAPAGYIKDSREIPVVIEAEYDETGVLLSYTITINGESTDHYTAAVTSKLESITKSANNTSFPVVNTKGTELPSTGGMGTTLFYIIGAVLVLGAGVLLITRRRMSAN